MFVGTCSDAGKSILNTAFCRIFLQDGYAPAPFKAQNMSLNSYSTPEGGELGRAQAVQAEACGIAPHTDMNPVLLKPSSDQTSQVVLNGQPVGNMSAREYFREGNKMKLFDEAVKAFRRLETRYNPIVLEGAGSISELNLKDRDITNMRMALEVGAATYLVADIDRGGVFASVYGSVMLLTPEERRLLKGIIINKFRGDISLFDEGKRIIEELTGIPVVGVIPYYNDIHIEEEDSVALETKNIMAEEDKLNVAVIRLRHMSNYTDFKVMEQDERFHIYYTQDVAEIAKAHIIILPGTKTTIADLQEIRANGVADAIIDACKQGKKIVGICGGYQMMGVRVDDPEHIEGPIDTMPGLGILPVVSVIETQKVVCQSTFTFLRDSNECKGYQIHMGRTSSVPLSEFKPIFGPPAFPVPSGMTPVVHLTDGMTDGCMWGDFCWGTYMHGILDNACVRDYLTMGFENYVTDHSQFDYINFKEQQYNLLAERVREAVDLLYIYTTLTDNR